jgi:uncharacterized Ntn-hydrolase superfamily protein
MTFSVVARDRATGDLGGAVQSRFLAVGSLVLHAEAGRGSIATQALGNPSYGPRGLGLLAAGASAEQAVAILVGSDGQANRRQLGVVDAAGRVAAHSGAACSPWAGHATGDGFSCQGNILVSGATVQAMAEVMADTTVPFPERLVQALVAGQQAGGDSRGQQSAGLLVVRAGGGYGGLSDRYIDLRVDDHSDPIVELGRLLRLHRLYFDKPGEDELLPIRGELAAEIARLLEERTQERVLASDLDALWDRLDRWAGRENLEERMVRRGAIDRTVLTVLRGRSSP